MFYAQSGRKKSHPKTLVCSIRYHQSKLTIRTRMLSKRDFHLVVHKNCQYYRRHLYAGMCPRSQMILRSILYLLVASRYLPIPQSIVDKNVGTYTLIYIIPSSHVINQLNIIFKLIRNIKICKTQKGIQFSLKNIRYELPITYV